MRPHGGAGCLGEECRCGVQLVRLSRIVEPPKGNRDLHRGVSAFLPGKKIPARFPAQFDDAIVSDPLQHFPKRERICRLLHNSNMHIHANWNASSERVRQARKRVLCIKPDRCRGTSAPKGATEGIYLLSMKARSSSSLSLVSEVCSTRPLPAKALRPSSTLSGVDLRTSTKRAELPGVIVPPRSFMN